MLTNTEVKKLINDSKNKNTLKKTSLDIGKVCRFLRLKGETKQLHLIEVDLLDEYLANFILSIQRKDGQEYEHTTIRNKISSIDRHLKDHKCPHKIIGK